MDEIHRNWKGHYPKWKCSNLVGHSLKEIIAISMTWKEYKLIGGAKLKNTVGHVLRDLVNWD